MPITLNTKVYTFAGWLQGRIATFVNRDSGVPAGFLTLTSAVDNPQGAGTSYKVRWKLKLPTLAEDQSCACPDGVVREDFADIVITVSKGSTTAERTAMATAIEDLTASPAFQQSVISLVVPAA